MNSLICPSLCPLSESNISASQRDALKRQDKLIGLSVVAKKRMEKAEQIMEELLNFRVDTENVEAALNLFEANKRIEEKGIRSDRWMIFTPGKVHWEPSLTQLITMKQVKDKKGNPVDGEPITMPLMTQSVNMSYQYLNW